MQTIMHPHLKQLPLKLKSNKLSIKGVITPF